MNKSVSLRWFLKTHRDHLSAEMLRPVILLCSLFLSAATYKILVYSSQTSRSHVSFMGHIADTLAEAGHDVTVFLPEFFEDVNTTGVKLAKAIVNPRRFKLMFRQEAEMQKLWIHDGEDPRQILLMMQMMTTLFSQLCQSQLADEEMKTRLRKEKFDLGIGEVIDPCSLAFIEALGIKAHIAAFSTNFFEAFGQPFGVDSNPSYVPAAFSPYSDEMTYFERAKNFGIAAMSSLLFQYLMVPSMEAVFHQYINKDLTYDNVLGRSTFILVNSEDLTEFSRPITKKIVYVGGIGAKKPQKLSNGFQKLMDDAFGGVVFVSFGSMMKSSMMPAVMKEAFIGTFRNFPEIKFIWKYEADDDLGSDVSNLVKTKWAPQNDLFGHPNLRGFVSHGGMNSIIECTHAGIPIVVIPLYGDQMRNAKMVEKRRVAVVINKHNVTTQSLTEAITAIVYNERFRNSARRLAEMIRKKPMSAKERVVKYIEFAAEFGHINNLNSAAVKLNFFQYYLLDIILPLLVVLLVTLLISIRIFIYLMHKASDVVKVKIE